MGRFLFCSTPGYGHIHPLLPLAQTLQQAGHSIAFATQASLRARMEGLGFDFFAVGGTLADDPEYQAFKAEQRDVPLSLESELLAYAAVWCGIAPRHRVPQVVEAVQRWRPDMLIREGGEYAAVIAAEYLDLPHATVAFATALKGMARFEQDAAAAGLDRVRQQWGLRPDPKLDALYRYLTLAYTPPRFGLADVGRLDGEVTVPTTTHFIQPTIFDTVGEDALPDCVTTLPTQPTVYVTLGTEVNREPELYPSVMQTLIDGLRDAPLNVIVTLGRDKDPMEFGPQPPHVHIEQYIPQSLLLPHCDVMVMHGGSNSLLAAVEAEVPMVVVPLIADQFFNAHVVAKMELGRVVAREALSPATVRAAVDEVLADPTCRGNVARLRSEMHNLPGQAVAVQLVEQVAAERQPLLNSELGSS